MKKHLTRGAFLIENWDLSGSNGLVKTLGSLCRGGCREATGGELLTKSYFKYSTLPPQREARVSTNNVRVKSKFAFAGVVSPYKLGFID